MQLQHLFNAEFQYQDDIPVIVGPDDREGALIGSGDGFVKGDSITGTIRWSMYSGNCAYLAIKQGIENPTQHLCTVNPGGVIETEDGGEIWFDAKGFGFRGPDPSQPHMWRLSMSLRFETTDERYSWLNTTLGVWEGEFNEKEGHARYAAYAPVADSVPIAR